MKQPAQKTPEMRLAIESKRKERMVKDTYEIRVKEGRPNHTNASIFAIIVGSLSWMIQFGCVMSPYWRTTYIGVIGYPHPRSWGIWMVSGKSTQGYWQQQTQTCEYYTQLNVGGVCASPICIWYRIKCITYMQMMCVSYSVGVAFVIELVLHLLCVFWTCSLTPRLIRWAATWWPVCALLHIGGWGVWVYMTDEQFGDLEMKSYYPTPGIGGGAYGSALALLGLLFNVVMGCQLYATWPEPDSDSEDSSEEDDGEQAASSYQQQAYPQQGYDPAYQQQGYDPSYQQQGGASYQQEAPQQGYDPAHQQGYQPPAQAQGYQAPAPGAGAPAW